MRCQREHVEQVLLMTMVRQQARRSGYEFLGRLFAIPNGGARSPRTAGMLKSEGVRAGVLDLCLPVARGRFHGLFVELKAPVQRDRMGRVVKPAGRASPEQLAEQSALIADGYQAVVCMGAEEAFAALMQYADLGPFCGPPSEEVVR